MPQLDILNHQVKPLVPEMGYIILSHWQKGFYRLLKHYEILSRLFVTYHNLVVRLHC